MPRQQQQQGGSGWQQGYAVATWLCKIHATPFEAAFRKPGTVGENYHGVPALLCLFWLPAFAAICGPPEEIAPLLIFGGIGLVMLCVHRAMRPQVQAGQLVHSYYKGASIFGMKEGYAIESVVSFVAGLALVSWSQPLGLYLLFGGVALAFNHWNIERRDRAQSQEIRDAIIAERILAERIRREMGL